jgi:hypothetical protein
MAELRPLQDLSLRSRRSSFPICDHFLLRENQGFLGIQFTGKSNSIASRREVGTCRPPVRLPTRSVTYSLSSLAVMRPSWLALALPGQALQHRVREDAVGQVAEFEGEPRSAASGNDRRAAAPPKVGEQFA